MKNRILIYDDNCPLCSWYSNLFVKTGLLDENGRKAFSTLEPEYLQLIDFNRGRNEIPMLDLRSGKTWYGIDSLLEILGSRFSLIKKMGHWQPVYWFLKKLYRLVSYNRKLIVARKCGEGKIDCAPDPNYFYRFVFMVLGLIFNTFMLFPVHEFILKPLSYYHLSISELQTAHFGLVIVNCLLALHFTKQKATEYLGQVNMLAILSTLLILPSFLFAKTGVEDFLTGVWITICMIFIFKEYLRRMEYAGVLSSNKWLAGINLAGLSAFLMILFG